METLISHIARELSQTATSVQAVIKLLDDDCTVPFIARYRKELTGGLDEIQIAAIRDRRDTLVELEKRRAFILESIASQEKLTPALESAIRAAHTLPELEDLYLPYKPKRRTRAQIAIEQGLEALAEALLAGTATNPLTAAASYVSEEKGVASAEAALQGARDIIAEIASESAPVREAIRDLFQRQSTLVSKPARGSKPSSDSVYRDYFDYAEAVSRLPSHRILALFRGEEAKELSLKIEIPTDDAQASMARVFLKPLAGKPRALLEQIELALNDSLERLIQPSLENELRAELKTHADAKAIEVFAQNLREVLMAAPLGSVSVLALDPGFRTGCKLAVLSPQGELLHHQAIYPLEPHQKTDEAGRALRGLIERYTVRAIAIGNGTGGRETLSFVSSLGLGSAIAVCLVNESGASIYSASEIARTEFPDLDLTIRGAVSIGRRLMDPLAELVKIDPKSIGVGQYQHDVDQKALKKSLDETVASCVNAVGVDLNTASPELLQYVSGLNSKTAQAIVRFRATKGAFKSRKQLMEVSGLGPKSFEQAAGFLRIYQGEEALDASAVHPESYETVYRMAQDIGLPVQNILKNEEALAKIRASATRYARAGQGVSVLDICAELARPARDPRPSFETFAFDEAIKTIADLKEGMVLPGVVTNVAAFGAFIDIGVHEQGLAHISQLADHFVSDPQQVVKTGQKVMARVLAVDLARKRISLTLKK